MSFVSRRVIVPPYCGVPIFPHQFAVVAAEVVTVDAGAVVELEFLLHDANTKDITSRQLKIKNTIFPFIFAPFILTLIHIDC
jgi:hypothetical protein